MSMRFALLLAVPLGALGCDSGGSTEGRDSASTSAGSTAGSTGAANPTSTVGGGTGNPSTTGAAESSAGPSSTSEGSTGPGSDTQPDERGGPFAFPGAEGYGKFATGGRGGEVLYVTNLDDSGPGSFRAAAEASGPRYILFAVSGTIVLDTPIAIQNGDVTIAGQTSPNGVTFRRYGIDVNDSNVVVRYIRSRLGREADASGLDAFRVWARQHDISDIIIDHSSFSWCRDENLDVIGTPNPPPQPELFGVSDVTLSWNMVSEGLENHAFGGFVKYQVSNVSVLYNLFSNNTQRNPNISGASGHLVNNFIYNYRGRGVTLDTGAALDVVGNYVELGPSTTRPHHGFMIIPAQSSVPLKNAFYVEGNVHSQYRPDAGAGEEWAVFAQDVQSSENIADEALHRRETPHGYLSVATHDAVTARAMILASAGASVVRDAVDTRLVAEASSGGTMGQIITDPSEVGGWPDIPMGTPYPDADGDGMDDDWEVARGLDPSDPSDGALDDDDDGYPNLEEFLHALTLP